MKFPYAALLMKRLKNVLKEILDETSYFTKLRDPTYFEEFQDLLGDHFWILPTSWNQTTPGLVYRESIPDTSLCLTEQFSDDCISSLLGSRKDDKEPCVVTAPCKKMMDQKGCTGYSLSHQLLFFIVGKMAHQGLSKRNMASNLNSSQFNIEKVKRRSFTSKLCGHRLGSRCVEKLQLLPTLCTIFTTCVGMSGRRIATAPYR
ncbi:unnamed protein product, partial [Ranitomeya imitator]